MWYLLLWLALSNSENKDIVIALNAIGANVGFVEIESDKGHDPSY